MSTPVELPAVDELGFCNILLSALGGDGANMAGKLLFKMGCLEFGLDGGYDARYGSEKKGTATDVSVRFCHAGVPVRQSGPTAHPHFVVLFHDDLIVPLKLGRGLAANAVCIVNSQKPAAELRTLLELHSGKIVTVDATKIARDCSSRLNMPLLALLCRELGFPPETLSELVAKQWPAAAKANLPAFSMALAGAASERIAVDEVFPLTSPSVERGPIGWSNMLLGGAIDALTHSTINRDNRIAGRGRVPKFDAASCNSCGICLTVCSDPGGLQWSGGKMVGVSEAFCKGCMRCVEVCPQTKKGKALQAPEYIAV